MRYIYDSIIYILVLIIVFWAANFRDPHLLFARDIEIYLIILASITLAVLSNFSKTIALKYFIYLLIFTLISTLIFKECVYLNAKNLIIENTSNKYSTINSRLIVGFRDKETIKKLSRNGIAGIFLTKRNIKHETYESLQLFLKQLQEDRKKYDLPVLIISTDQEGGSVSRLSPLIQRQESLAKEFGENKSAYEYGKKQGLLLSELGVNVNFSPVVDLKPTIPPGKLDFHSLIATRAISSNPSEVIEVSLKYIKGLEESGVTATLKHFPGLTRVQSDTHHFSATLDVSIDSLESSEWLPFTVLAKQTGAWIMLSHVILEKIDNINPVSISTKVIDELLRKNLNINNILITDDLTMGATYNRGFCDSVKQSFSTSVNYLLVAYDYEKYYDAILCFED